MATTQDVKDALETADNALEDAKDLLEELDKATLVAMTEAIKKKVDNLISEVEALDADSEEEEEEEDETGVEN